MTSDGRVRSDPAPVNLKISEVNDPPVLGADTATLGGAGTLPPIPPRPICRQPCGVIFGDPHLVTFDAAHYDFQAVGEFIAAKSTTDDFELQTRMAPVPPLRRVSIATAVAMRVAGHRVAIYRTLTGADTQGRRRADDGHGRAQVAAGRRHDRHVRLLERDLVVWPDGSVAIVARRRHLPAVLPLHRRARSPERPLGRTWSACSATRTGSRRTTSSRAAARSFPIPIPRSRSSTPATRTAGGSARPSRSSTTGPARPPRRSPTGRYPDAPATPGTLPPGVRAAATTQCGLFGVVVQQVLDACIVDVGLTGDPEFATSSAAAQEATYDIPDNTGVSAIGTPTTVTIGTAGQNAARAFTATAGQKVTLSVTGNTIAGRRPGPCASRDGAVVTSQFLTGPSAFHDVVHVAGGRDVHDHGRSARPEHRVASRSA